MVGVVAAHVWYLAFFLVVGVLERLVTIHRRRSRACLGIGTRHTCHRLGRQVPAILVARRRRHGPTPIVVFLFTLYFRVRMATVTGMVVILARPQRPTSTLASRIRKVEERTGGRGVVWELYILGLLRGQSSAQRASGQGANGSVRVH